MAGLLIVPVPGIGVCSAYRRLVDLVVFGLGSPLLLYLLLHILLLSLLGWVILLVLVLSLCC